MERAARLIRNSKQSAKIITEEEIARGIWPATVGRAIAAHTGELRLVRNKLVVEVEDAIWQKQLFTLSQQILARLRKVSGSDLIHEIEFRIRVSRRQPVQSESLQRTEAVSHASADEADRIQDPVLKKIYQLSRKKATA